MPLWVKQGKLGQGGDLLVADSFKYFANNRCKTDGPEQVRVCCVGCFCIRDSDVTAPVIRDPCSLVGEVKHVGKIRGH